MSDILCPTDFTAAADAAFAYATDIAERTGGSITLLHVLDKHERAEGPLAASTLMDRTAQEALQHVAQVNEVLREGCRLPLISGRS